MVGFFRRSCLRALVVARVQAVGNLTLTRMKARVTIENPSIRRMNAPTQALVHRMRHGGIFKCEGHSSLQLPCDDGRADAVGRLHL